MAETNQADKMSIDDYASMLDSQGLEFLDTEEYDGEEAAECSFCEEPASFFDEDNDVYLCAGHHDEAQEKLSELQEEE